MTPADLLAPDPPGSVAPAPTRPGAGRAFPADADHRVRATGDRAPFPADDHARSLMTMTPS